MRVNKQKFKGVISELLTKQNKNKTKSQQQQKKPQQLEERKVRHQQAEKATWPLPDDMTKRTQLDLTGV